MKNNTKTILFASVLTAMIITVGGMTYAQAANENANNTETTQDRLEKLAELKANIQYGISASIISEHIDVDLAIKRIELAENFVTLENQGQADTIEAQYIMRQLQQTQTGIEYPNVIRDENPQLVQTLRGSNYTYDTYSTNSVSRDNCSSQGTDYGSASGSITGYSSSAYLVGSLSYPSLISNGIVGSCTNTNWSDSDMTYVLLVNPFVGCAQPNFTSSTDLEGGTCNYLKYGDIVLVTVSKSKYSSTNFSSSNPATIVVL